MIFGFVKIENNAVITHRDSFMLDTEIVVSVRRPFRAGALILSSALLGFGFAFSDLLYGHEILLIGVINVAILLIGTQIGQLTLLSKILKGTEFSSAIWGSPKALQKIRAQIVEERQRYLHGGSHEHG